ncbi:MAG: alpha/beta hydrolase [Variovorax sp.]
MFDATRADRVVPQALESRPQWLDERDQPVRKAPELEPAKPDLANPIGGESVKVTRQPAERLQVGSDGPASSAIGAGAAEGARVPAIGNVGGGGGGVGGGLLGSLGSLFNSACLVCATGAAQADKAHAAAGASGGIEISAVTSVIATGVGVSMDSSKASDTIRLLFGTNRQSSSDTKGSMRNAFTSIRGDVAFGYVDVSVPPTHVVGAIERPSIWKLEISEDPTQHMVIRGIALVQSNQFADLINQYRGPKTGKPTILFVHGYNVSFDDAALRTAQIAYDLRMDSVPAFFSWASRAGVADYTVDENTALQSIPDFKKFLRAFAANSTDRIFLIAHSMGSRIVSHALTEMISTEPQVVSKVTQLVLAAPDLDAVVFKEQIVPAFRKQKIPVTLYASSKDKTLQASSKIHGCCRAGLGGSNIVISEGLESVDATAIDTGFLSHSYFAETRPLLTDLNLLLAQGMRAASRPLLGGKPVGNPTYYYFRQ